MHVREQLTNLEAQLNYVNNVLSTTDLEEWERKEYSALVKDYENQISELSDYIKENNL